MKKKNGFTLVELMATIAILVLMSLVIGTNIVSILRATEDNEEAAIKNDLEKAACVYVDSSLNKDTCTTRCKIPVQNLIESGLIDESYEEEYSDKYVEVTYKDGEKICTYK